MMMMIVVKFSITIVIVFVNIRFLKKHYSLIICLFIPLSHLLLQTIFKYLNLHPRSQLFEKEKPTTLIFLQISQSIWMKCSMLPQSVGLFKLLLNLSCTINIQGRVPYTPDLKTNTKKTLTMALDGCGPFFYQTGYKNEHYTIAQVDLS